MRALLFCRFDTESKAAFSHSLNYYTTAKVVLIFEKK
jgi:hypothetical protein